MYRTMRTTLILVVILAMAGALQAQVEPERLPEVAAKAYRHADLDIEAQHNQIGQLPPQAAAQAQQRLARLGVDPASARVDRRGGRFSTLLPATPLVPGKGVGNTLSWGDLKVAEPESRQVREKTAGQSFTGYLEAHQAELDIDLDELSAGYRVTSHGNGVVYQIYAPRTIDGIAVRGSYVTAVISHGNLVLFAAHQWGDRGAATRRPQLSLEEAQAAADDYVAPLNASWDKGEQLYVPMARGQGPNEVGRGYRYQPVWALRTQLKGDSGTWEALVDAYTGDVLAFEDLNQYATVRGGVLPVTNDGIYPDGVEQAGWPMPYLDTTLGTTDTGGNVAGSGSITATFYGTYVNINDNCGSDSLTQTDNIDWGTSGGTDCTTPGFGGAGNTHASRTGFYELNRIIEMARGQLPSNSWLQQRLTSNMNINSTCNAYWNGTVNFYRSGSGCSNTGEIAGVFDHEWGHGLDQNDATPGIASPSGEGIADIYTALRLNDSCIGRNFRPGVVCGGYGDPCTVCTGVRDIDYLMHDSGQPHDYTWSNANCSSVHCRGHVYSEAVWSLWKRKLQAAPYNMDNNTAYEIVTRLTFIAAGATGTWFSGSPPYGGCGSGSGYLNYLAADDDNGNINDGTPHMQAIYDAFNDQEIACNTPTPVDSGCAGVPTSAPIVTGSAADTSVDLSWGSVAGATKYQIFRTEGVFACDFGKVKLGETTGTSYSDVGLQNGRQYSYVVIPIGGADPCMGPASACTNVTPASGPNLTIDTGSAALVITGGDSDAYLDNCENGTMTFDVDNTGAGTLTNVRILGVTPSNAGVVVTTGFPAAISPSTLTQGATGTGSFSFTAGGLSSGETLTFTVEVTADELAASKSAGLDVLSTETDLTLVPAQTYTFETGTDGWTTIQGTFNRSSTGGGAGGTTWYEQSSANLDNQCDQTQSPVMVLTPTSTLTLSNNFDIEPMYTNNEWYDRANIGIVPVATGSRTLVSPDGGRLYNATGANGTCGTSGQDGWADAATTWAASTFSATALGSAGFAGQEIQLDVRYGTDASLNGYGFRFDEVTVTDVSSLGSDGQGDSCGCDVPADCDDGLWCNGAEDCVAGSCQAGTPPTCDDGVACTDDSCNEGTDSCDFTPIDATCDNGLYCDGAETCHATLGCQAAAPVNCDDGVGCTADSCNESTDQCDNTPNHAACDNGLYCDGVEVCNLTLDCQDGSDPCTGSQTCDEVNDVCEGGGGPQDAIYDAGLGAPKCAIAGSECDSLALLDGRDSVGPEPNQPNTLDSCTDGTSGTYHSDESNDAIVVKTLDEADFVEGATVQVDATVYAWSTGTSDHLDLYYAADANSPAWTHITTIDLTSGGLQTLSAQYTLPAGTLQAVRASFRYNGTPSSCSTGSYDDADDLVFAVNPANPCTGDPDCDDGLFCNGAETCNAGTCQAGSDPCPGQSCDEVGDICVAGGCVVDDDFEAGAPDWTNDPASTCTTGDYVTGDPTNPTGGYQIVGSHSGVTSIFSATNTTAGVDDIDGGNCILGSPTWAVPTASTLSVWYWHGQRDAGDDASGDFFLLEYSINDGASWTTLASNGDSTSNPTWTEATAAIPAGSDVQLRMQCSDGPSTGDLVECGIDDFSICD